MIAQHITFDIFVGPPVPVVTDDLPPGQSSRAWSPITATLISGDRDAVLADALLTVEQGRALAGWVAAKGKNLTTVYITHGHGDHWFGLGGIRRRFPKVRVLALPSVVEYMRQQVSPKRFAALWESRFPGQIEPNVPVAEALSDRSFELEGRELVAIETGHTDTEETSILHVPSINLVVAGDVVYNDVHVYFAESDHDKRLAWIHALDTVEALQPHAVVAGHKRAGRSDDPTNIEETRVYIRDFDRIAENTRTANELYEQMLAAYPNRVNPGSLWSSARALKG